MCWSLEVSALTVAFEVVAFAIVLHRSLTSTKRVDKEKFYILFGGALSVILVETVEVLLWMNKNEIVPILEGIHGTCSTRNANLTRLLPLIIFTQPMGSIWFLGKVSGKKVQDRLTAPFYLAVIYYVSTIMQIIMGENFGYFVRSVGDVHMNFEGAQTCTFLGPHGHFQWMVKMSAPWFLPNGSMHLFLQLLPMFTGLPTRHLIPHCIVVLNVILCIIYTEGTFEAGSIYCWTGLLSVGMMLIEPYLPFPPLNEDEDEDKNADIAIISQDSNKKNT